MDEGMSMATIDFLPMQRNRGFCRPNEQFMGNLEGFDADFKDAPMIEQKLPLPLAIHRPIVSNEPKKD
jgi:hypothetical protein